MIAASSVNEGLVNKRFTADIVRLLEVGGAGAESFEQPAIIVGDGAVCHRRAWSAQGRLVIELDGDRT
jgi:hypothetical protein